MSRTRIHHFKNFSVKRAGVDLEINFDHLEKNFNDAQKALDQAIMTSMEPFMPMQDGTFINVTRAESAAMAGSGKVCAAAAPQGRFLYQGKNMVDEKTGSPFARDKAEKVLVSQYRGKTNAKINLTYSKSRHPKAQAHWFDAAKKRDADKWVKAVKKAVGEE